MTDHASTPAAPASPQQRVLVVEDDPLVVRLVQRVLTEAGYAVDVAQTLDAARDLVGADFDAVLLDIDLPGGSGLDLLRELRGRGDATPVLLFTGSDSDADVVTGLDAGADDYIVKPVAGAVLLARLRAVARRAASADGTRAVAGTLTLDGLRLDRLARRVELSGQTLDLTPKEFTLLEYLLLRAEEAVQRGELLEHVWQVRGEPNSNVVDAHVARLRQKLRAVSPRPDIRTVRGVGFMLTRDGE